MILFNRFQPFLYQPPQQSPTNHDRYFLRDKHAEIDGVVIEIGENEAHFVERVTNTATPENWGVAHEVLPSDWPRIHKLIIDLLPSSQAVDLPNNFSTFE